MVSRNFLIATNPKNSIKLCNDTENYANTIKFFLDTWILSILLSQNGKVQSTTLNKHDQKPSIEAYIIDLKSALN